MHPWHDVSPGKELPRDFQALIEIPLGSNVKYELDKTTGLLRVDRIIHSAVFYPANYGFIPKLTRKTTILSMSSSFARKRFNRSLSSRHAPSA